MMTCEDLPRPSSQTYNDKDHKTNELQGSSEQLRYDTSVDNYCEIYSHSLSSEQSRRNDMLTCEGRTQPINQTHKDKQHKTTKTHKLKLAKNPPSLNKETWKMYDSEFNNSNLDSWTKLKKGEITVDKFIDKLNTDLASFLESKEEFQYEVKEFFKHKAPKNNPLEEMKKEKIKLNKKAKAPNATPEDRSEASKAVRLYNHLLKLAKEKASVKLAKREEKEYKRNFWKTAKSVTNGTFEKEESAPTFDKTTGDKFYKERYEKSVEVDPEQLKWFPTVEEPTVPYNMDPYKPKDIMKALSKKNKNSAPGEDGVVYEYFQKMTSLHKVLATAFSKVRDSGDVPDSWAKSKLILLKKR